MIFSLILWSPFKNNFEDVISDFNNSNIRIVRKNIFCFENENFESMVKKVYEPDSIADWKIIKKLEELSKRERILCYLEIEIPKNFYGKSYKNAIDGNDFSGREEIVGNITTTRSFDDMMGKPTEGYWIRNKDWFLNWNITEEEINLFDMKIDQKNDNNRADQEPEIVQTMIEKIKTWKDERKREV